MARVLLCACTCVRVHLLLRVHLRVRVHLCVACALTCCVCTYMLRVHALNVATDNQQQNVHMTP